MLRLSRTLAPLAALALLTTLAAPVAARAQDVRDLSVKTFTLNNLRPEDAAKLLAPYVTAPRGGVYEAGSIRAITVRETPSVLAMIDSILKVHDRARATLSLRFQLIAALDTARRDPSIAGIDAELRKLFKFQGYELIGEGTAMAEELNNFTSTMTVQTAVDKSGTVMQERFTILGWVERLDAASSARTVRLTVTLRDDSRGPAQAPELLETGLTMPLGQSIILGSAAAGLMARRSRSALILVVQPELAVTKR